MGRVLNRSFMGVFKNIKPLLLAIVIVILISTIVSSPVYLLDMSDPVALTQSPIYWAVTFTSSIMAFFSFMFFCVFTDHLAFAQFTNRSAGFRYVFLRSLKLTIPVLFIVFLYFISSYIGMIFLIVPGVIISVGWAVVGPAYLHEDTSLFGSFGRSWSLTSGYKWWVWLATIIMGVIATLLFSVIVGVAVAFSIPGLSETDLSDPSYSAGFTIGIFLAGILMNFLLYLALALYASFTTALYTELRELKEGPLAEEMSAIFD